MIRTQKSVSISRCWELTPVNAVAITRSSGITVLVYRLMVATDCGDISVSSVIRSPSDRSAWTPKRWEALFTRPR